MRRAALVAPVRTAVGHFGGALRDVPAETLAATVIKETVARSGIDPILIEDVMMGQSYATPRPRASAGGRPSKRDCRSASRDCRPTTGAAPDYRPLCPRP